MKIIKLGSKEILVINDLPEGSMNFRIYNNSDKLYFDNPTKDIASIYFRNWHIGNEVDLPIGKWQILGKSENITEEQANNMMPYKQLDVDSSAEEDQQRWYYDKAKDRFDSDALRCWKSFAYTNQIENNDLILLKI